MSFGASLSMGTDFPLKFQMSMFPRLLGVHPNASYTSRKRCRQLARSSSRFTYITRPWAHCQSIHFFPSAIAMHSSIWRKDFPALDGPAISILCPFLSTLSIRHGDSSGILSHTLSRPSGSGRSSLMPSIHSCHSSQLRFPMLVSTRNCFLSPRMTPGIRDSLDGFLFWVSIMSPFFSHTL